MQLHTLCCNQNNDDVIKISFLPVGEQEVLVDMYNTIRDKTHTYQY